VDTSYFHVGYAKSESVVFVEQKQKDFHEGNYTLTKVGKNEEVYSQISLRASTKSYLISLAYFDSLDDISDSSLSDSSESNNFSLDSELFSRFAKDIIIQNY